MHNAHKNPRLLTLQSEKKKSFSMSYATFNDLQQIHKTQNELVVQPLSLLHIQGVDFQTLEYQLGTLKH